jgi:hypothetical protein
MPSKGFPSFFAVATVLGFTCCASPHEGINKYYVPLSFEARAPKPDSFEPLILRAPPNRPWEAIGHASFASLGDFAFTLQGLKMLARKHGADAIIVGNSDRYTRRVPFVVPPSVSVRPVTTSTSGTTTVTDPYGRSAVGNFHATSTRYDTEVEPGFSGVRDASAMEFRAQFIVFK